MNKSTAAARRFRLDEAGALTWLGRAGDTGGEVPAGRAEPQPENELPEISTSAQKRG